MYARKGGSSSTVNFFYPGPMRQIQETAVDYTSGRIHGEFLRLLYPLGDNKTKLYFRALDEAIDV